MECFDANDDDDLDDDDALKYCHSEGNIDVNPVNPTSTSSRYERY